MLKSLLILMLIAPLSFAQAADDNALKNETSLSYVLTGGNSESETASLKQNTTYKWSGHDSLTLTGHYLNTSGQVPGANTASVSKSVRTAENWSALLKYDHQIIVDKFSMFVSHGRRGDIFQGIREAHDSNIGAKYIWTKNDTTEFSTSLGYQYTKELLLVPKDNQIYPEYHLARLFNEYKCSHSKTFGFGIWVEYLSGLTNFAKDQRVNWSPYITSALSDMFSLKVAYEGHYRFEPAVTGNKYNDYIFTTSILATY